MLRFIAASIAVLTAPIWLFLFAALGLSCAAWILVDDVIETLS
jgi:hypothetical protein